MARTLLSALILVCAVAGTASAQYEQLDGIVRDGVRRGVYPGAAVVVGNSSGVLFARGYGHFTWNARSPIPSPDSTLWDIASLTKVVATAAVAALLVDQGRLALDTPVVRYLPQFTGGDRPRVTVRMLLDHTSGLPAGLPPTQRRVPRDSLVAILYRLPLRRAPGAAAQYSDLNAILLGLVIERITERPLDRVATELVFTPLGMRETRYLPEPALHPRIAPTGQWRGTPLAGRVNDRTAEWLGGVAGHAGLFASAADLGRYATWWLRSGAPVLHSAIVDTFLKRGAPPSARLLGWESRVTEEYTPSPYGTLLSSRGYGHSGYTGTMIIIDPARDLYVVFVTNRVFGPRVAKPFTALHQLRARLVDAAIRAVPGACRAGVMPPC